MYYNRYGCIIIYNTQIKILLYIYFLGITDAMLFHEGKLELEGDESIIANASINPKYSTVQYLHHLWRTLNLGPRIGDGVLEVNIINYHNTTNNGYLNN